MRTRPVSRGAAPAPLSRVVWSPRAQVRRASSKGSQTERVRRTGLGTHFSRRVAACACALLAVFASGSAASSNRTGRAITGGSSAFDWAQFHQNPLLTGWASNSPLSTSTASQLGVAWATDLYGPALDSPVVAYDSALGKTRSLWGRRTGTSWRSMSRPARSCGRVAGISDQIHAFGHRGRGVRGHLQQPAPIQARLVDWCGRLLSRLTPTDRGHADRGNAARWGRPLYHKEPMTRKQRRDRCWLSTPATAKSNGSSRPMPSGPGRGRPRHMRSMPRANRYWCSAPPTPTRASMPSTP